MADYPQTVLDFNERFRDDAACRPYLESIRWPEGARYPRCPPAKVWRMKAPFYRCAFCGHDFTVTAGTLFADTHLPLRLWFQAMWYVVNQKNRASALGVQRVLGLGSYRTAWRWLHKLRRAMVRPSRDRLSGTVEVDEVYIGGERPGKRGRGAGWQGFGADRRASRREQDRPDSLGAGEGCVGSGVGASNRRCREPRQPSAPPTAGTAMRRSRPKVIVIR